MVRRKKREYKHRVLSQMTVQKNEKNLKQFWKLLEKINPKRNDHLMNVQPLSFFNHLKKNTFLKHPSDTPPKTGKKEHYKRTGKSSKNIKKAAGFDNVHNDIISSLIDANPEVILKLFNAILNSFEVITDWVIGFIVPIYKKGLKSNPLNYRGITLISCFGKLFLSILNNRLMQFTIENNFLHKSQFSFLPGNRTSDAHIINNLIRNICHKSNSKIFSCFFDLSTAFDTIPRDILLKKLSHNIEGKFFNIIRNIYISDNACVKIGNQCTETFVMKGARQGCVLSPLLFNIFLSDLPKKLVFNEGKITFDNTEISSLVWADDMVLVADSEGGIQQMLKSRNILP